MMRPARLIAAGGSAIAILVPGCAAGSGHTAPSTATNASTRLTAEQRSALAEAQRRSKEPGQAAAMKRYQQQFERFVTDCMRQAGFRYVPPPPDPRGPSDGPPWDATRFGFGISTLIDAAVQLPAPAGAAPKATLDPAERAAHNRAAGECNRKAQQRLGLPPGMVVVDADLTAITDEARRQADRDPRVVRLITAWAGCMRAAGIVTAGRTEMLDQIKKQAQPFRDIYLAAQAGHEGAPIRLTDLLTADQRQDLAGLQRFELRAAAADRRCDHGLKATTYRVFQEKLDMLTGTAPS
jgi:hypothetical protein